jgi:hypothetical protein
MEGISGTQTLSFQKLGRENKGAYCYVYEHIQDPNVLKYIYIHCTFYIDNFPMKKTENTSPMNFDILKYHYTGYTDGKEKLSYWAESEYHSEILLWHLTVTNALLLPNQSPIYIM